MVRTGGLEPPRAYARRIFLPATVFTAIRRAGCLWSGLSLHRASFVRGLGAARLVSTPSEGFRTSAWLGIASKGFPEFEQFYITNFSVSTQSLSKSVASTDFATSASHLFPESDGTSPSSEKWD